MSFSILDIVMMALGLVTLILWMVFYVKGLSQAGLFEPLDEKDYPLKEIYFVGYAIVDAIKYQYKSKSDRKLRRDLEVLYESKYADYYMRVVYSQKITMGFTVLVIAFALYGLADSLAAFGVGVMFAGLAYYYYGTMAEKKILARSEEMLSDFSEVVSKLALLTNAGMILREAWEEIAYTRDSALYVEMQKAVEDMNNGIAEVDAIFRFGTRCIIPEIKKFASTMVQGITKGNSELTLMLMTQSKEVWAAKKQNVRRQGEVAASKLLIPICIMFIGILIMILVPIFTNLGT